MSKRLCVEVQELDNDSSPMLESPIQTETGRRSAVDSNRSRSSTMDSLSSSASWEDGEKEKEEDEGNDLRRLRAEKNRQYAQRSRQRKKQLLADMEQALGKAHGRIDEIESENKRLRIAHAEAIIQLEKLQMENRELILRLSGSSGNASNMFPSHHLNNAASSSAAFPSPTGPGWPAGFPGMPFFPPMMQISSSSSNNSSSNSSMGTNNSDNYKNENGSDPSRIQQQQQQQQAMSAHDSINNLASVAAALANGSNMSGSSTPSTSPYSSGTSPFGMNPNIPPGLMSMSLNPGFPPTMLPFPQPQYFARPNMPTFAGPPPSTNNNQS